MSHFYGVITLIVLLTALLWFAIGWWVASIDKAKQQRARETEWTHNLNTLRRDRDAFRSQVEVAHGKIRVLENRRADGTSPPKESSNDALTRAKAERLQSQLDQARVQIKSFARKIEDLSQQGVAREDALEQLRKKLTDTSRALHERDQKLTSLGQENSSQLKATSGTSGQDSTVQKLRIELQSARDSAAQDRQRLDHTIGEHMQTISALRSELAMRKDEIGTTTQSGEYLASIALKNEIEALKKENLKQSEHIARLTENDGTNDQGNSRLKSLQAEFDSQRHVVEELERLIAQDKLDKTAVTQELKEQLKEQRSVNEALSHALSTLEQKYASAKTELSEQTDSLRSSNEAHDDQELNELGQLLEQQKSTIEKLELEAIARDKKHEKELLEMRDAMNEQEHIVAQLRDVLAKPTTSPARVSATRKKSASANVSKQPQSGDLFAGIEKEEASKPPAPKINLYTEAPDTSDDLKKINGIGPAFEKSLNKLGLYTFDQIAELSKEDIEWVAQELRSFPDRILNGGWVAQAQKLLSESR